MPVFGIFRKNKRVVGFHRYSRIFGAIFLLAVICLPLFSSLTRAADVPVRSVTISSERTNYINNEPGSWNVTKSAEWIDAGKARITFEVNSVAKYEEGINLDVLMVIDNSGSMSGDKMTQMKEDATDLAETLLSNSGNRMALVTFNSSASIISGFMNNKADMLSYIDELGIAGCTNYNQGYIKALEVLEGYTQRENTELVMLFLTDGVPNEEVPNEIAQYNTLKSKYPYVTINGIQYEMGDTVLQPIIDVSDNQYIATLDSLNNVLFDATITPYIYDNFVITDYIDNNYWNIESIDAIEASLGTVALDYEGSTPKVTWDMSGLYRSGTTQTLTIDINLKDELITTEDLLLPTNTHETIESTLKDTPDEDIDSDLTPILKSTYDVIYDANAPSDCEPAGAVPVTTAHTAFTTVEISDSTLSCSGYNFRGWQSDINETNKINDDYFKMPERDVALRAIWAKPSISKSMDGEMHVKATATFDTGRSVNVKLKKLSGQSSASYSTQNTTITAVEKAGTLSDAVDTSDSAYIISSSDSMVPIYAWYDNGIIYYYTDAEDIYLNINASQMFGEMRNLASIGGTDEWITSNTTYMSNMFYYAGYSATTWSIGDLSNWDTSSVTNMSYMFSEAGYSATTWSIGDLSNWDTSSVTDMNRMFRSAGHNATSWSVGDLSSWNTASVTDMGDMFSSAGHNATSWSVGDLSSWNTERVKYMYNMFSNAGYSATSWSVGDLSNWNTASVTYMSYMFFRAGYTATSWSVGDLSNWNTASVTNMGDMFSEAGYSATSWSVGDLSSWNTASVTNMGYMFRYAGRSATSWSVGDLSSWNTASVTDMSAMFSGAGYSAKSWSVGDLSSWNTARVTNMSYMFSSAGYSATSWSVGDLSSWNTARVTNMINMFNNAGYAATSFELNLSSWNTASVTDMRYMFYGAGYSAKSWSVGDLSGWNTASVTSMSRMFQDAGYSAKSWSVGDLSGWNTASVTSMSNMFQNAGYSATSFELNLSSWNTARVKDMSDMFSGAGYSATSWSVKIPATNGAGIANATSKMYGKKTSVYATPLSGKEFSLVTVP